MTPRTAGCSITFFLWGNIPSCKNEFSKGLLEHNQLTDKTCGALPIVLILIFHIFVSSHLHHKFLEFKDIMHFRALLP